MTKVPTLKPAERRLLRGYGPLVLLVATFVVITATVPTVAPQQNVAVPLAADAAAVSGQLPGTTPAGGVPGAPGVSGAPGTTPSGRPTAGGVAAPGAANGHLPGRPATGGGAQPGAAPGGKLTACSGPQVKGDPYSPPCATFSGSNGGATSRGVTANEIVISYMNPTDGSKSFDENVKDVTGHYNNVIFPETYDQVIATMQNLITYFNTHFQFYGRKMVLKVFNGKQNGVGSNQSQVNADALNVANSIKAFAEFNGANQAYVQALANQRVLSFGSLYASQQFYQQFAPYAWSYAPDCTSVAKSLAEVAVKGLAGRPAAWAGEGVDKSGQRRFAVLAPDVPIYQQCAAVVTAAMKNSGHPPTTVIAYPFIAAQASSISQNITQQIINNKISTVLCLCDPISQLLYSGNLANAHYVPEIIDGAVVGEETDLIAQQMNQTTWAHAVTVTNEVAFAGKYGSTLGYFAAKSVDPNAFVVNEVDVLYLALYQIALGIQTAGPNLTPQTFAQGLHGYAGANGPYGPWTWHDGAGTYYAPMHQYRLQWYDPQATSSFDGEQGAWQILPTWYGLGSLPNGQPPLFPNGTR